MEKKLFPYSSIFYLYLRRAKKRIVPIHVLAFLCLCDLKKCKFSFIFTSKTTSPKSPNTMENTLEMILLKKSQTLTNKVMFLPRVREKYDIRSFIVSKVLRILV